MRGMDDGPWTGLGTLGWFLGVWVVMMAAMMFPSVAPTVALYSRMTEAALAALAAGCSPAATCSPGPPPALVAFALAAGVDAISGDVLAWDRAGRGARRRHAGRRRRLRADAAQGRLPRQVPQPARLPARLVARRAGPARCGWARKNGAWCVGCCWALMASLFALGIMSVTWMAVVAGLIAVEKTLPWRRVATYGTAALLLTLGVLVLVAPHVDPGAHHPRRCHGSDGFLGDDDGAAAPRVASGHRATSSGGREQC